MTSTLEIIAVALALGAGMVLGAFYFGGLWWTVRSVAAVRRPGVLLGLSFALRTGITLFAFYLIMAGRWQRLVACVAGFIVMRQILVRRLGPVEMRQKQSNHRGAE